MAINVDLINIDKHTGIYFDDFVSLFFNIYSDNSLDYNSIALFIDDKIVSTCVSGVNCNIYNCNPTISGCYTITASGLLLHYMFYTNRSFYCTVSASNYISTVVKKFDFNFCVELSVDKVMLFNNNNIVTHGVIYKNTDKYINEGIYSTYFKVKDYNVTKLLAYIDCFGHGYSDIYGHIKPQHMFLEHGHTYYITISGIKDYYGNESKIYKYTFTIK